MPRIRTAKQRSFYKAIFPAKAAPTLLIDEQGNAYSDPGHPVAATAWVMADGDGFDSPVYEVSGKAVTAFKNATEFESIDAFVEPSATGGSLHGWWNIDSEQKGPGPIGTVHAAFDLADDRTRSAVRALTAFLAPIGQNPAPVLDTARLRYLGNGLVEIATTDRYRMGLATVPAETIPWDGDLTVDGRLLTLAGAVGEGVLEVGPNYATVRAHGMVAGAAHNVADSYPQVQNLFPKESHTLAILDGGVKALSDAVKTVGGREVAVSLSDDVRVWSGGEAIRVPDLELNLAGELTYVFDSKFLLSMLKEGSGDLELRISAHDAQRPSAQRPVEIVAHPDVRMLLMPIRCSTDVPATRAQHAHHLAYLAEREEDARAREAAGVSRW